jgi:hypothetical protein
LKKLKSIWLIRLMVTLALIIVPIVIVFAPGEDKSDHDPWANLPLHLPHTDPSDIVQGSFGWGLWVNLPRNPFS